MNPVRSLRKTAGLTQQEVAESAGTSQSAVAAYEAELKSPTWRTIDRLASSVGYTADVRFFPELTREERRSMALHATIAEKLRANQSGVLKQARHTLARMRSLHPDARQLLDEWRLLMRRPLSALLPILTDPSPWARELRHVTPFAGVLSARERANVYRGFAVTERANAATSKES